MDATNEIKFSDIFRLSDIQRIQDLFADATGVASIITYPDGKPITRPSNFCRLCNEIIRKTETGLSNCFKSDSEIGRPNPTGPIIQPCLSGGLWDAGASIIVGGRHIANWLIGQVKNEGLDSDQMIRYADKIGADREEFMNALMEVPVMTKERFEKIAQMLFVFANELSSKAYHNSQLVQSINERRTAEEKLEHEQYLMRNLMDNLPDHIYFKDLESKFLRTNRSHAHSFGLDDPDQMIGNTDFDFFRHEDAQQAFEDEQQIIKTGLPVQKEERLTRKDNTDAWFSAIKMPLHDLSGKIIGTFGISRDITRAKLAAEELIKSELINRTLIKHLPQRIFIKDPDSKYILCNDIYSRDLGIDPKEIAGKDDFDFFSADLAEKYQTDDKNVISEGVQKEFEEKYSISNKERWTHVNKVPYRDANNKIVGVLGIFEDITDRKLAEEEINLKNELLLTINAEKDKFFSILAHDLKGPLSAFLDATRILTEEIQNMSLDEIKDITVSMKESASSIYGLLENLLEWSRLKRGTMEFSPERINVKQNIVSCIEILNESARRKEISIDCSLTEDLVITADRHMFETIIRNLVSNAIKFTPRSGKIFISASKNPDKTINVRVRDTGIGMKKELISRLFLLSEKTNRKGTDGEPSTGLGLLLCKEFIDKHSGKIRVESEEGKGSIFSIIFKQQ